MKIKLILLLMLFGVFAFGQKMPSDYFDEAGKAFNEGQMDEALSGYLYIVENYPRNELYPRALHNVAYIYSLQKEYKKSIEYYTMLMRGGQDEHEPLGADIMSDSYANYRHRAASQISDCYFELQQYDSALYYLALSDTTYPYLSDCGNAYASNDIQTALRYADIYLKLGQKYKAIEKLLPEIFNTELADNSEIISKLEWLLAGKTNLLKELDKSIDNVYLKTVTSTYRSYQHYCIEYMGVEVVYPEGFNSQEYNEEGVKNRMRQSEFYKMIERIN
ncbi:MAG: hypothetical protein IKO62_10165 [Bacteroidales bacterium]|nr:hypothetical protein [Bacteroidales bacterium]